MSSGSEYADADDTDSAPLSRPVSRLRSHTPQSTLPRKRRRLGSIDPSRIRKYDLEGKYNDSYRVLFNHETSHAAGRFEVNDTVQHYNNLVGTSEWSSKEQAVFFAALERLGRDDSPAISRAIGTKSEAEVRAFLLLLQDAASKHGNVGMTLRDIPAAIEIAENCNQRLEEASDALAWYQERLEATQEQERYGDYWLITPQVADAIEHAIDPLEHPKSLSTPQAAEFERTGPGIAGACTQCKKRKVKCNRSHPCTSCVRSKADCIYPDTHLGNTKQSTADVSDGDSTDSAAPVLSNSLKPSAHILQIIPEGNLLQPQAMLTLSRTFFMNRSPNFPSAWLHWSEYTSQLATEPSMYRTAFNDFHALVISVTRRLVLTAMTQATSRLRAQRCRWNRKGSSPFVKKRDVFAALDVLAFDRNGRDYWKGVPRRCGLQIYTTKIGPKGRLKRQMTWDEVERLMSSALPSHPPTTSGLESLDESDDFRARSFRSGTPLPMQNLTLSSPEDRSQASSGSQRSDESMDAHVSDEMLRRPALSQARDRSGRYASAPPISVGEDPSHHSLTLEAFDQEASLEEERVLWDMLGLDPPSKHDRSDHDGSNESACNEIREKLATDHEDWRGMTTYRSEWEEFTTLLRPATMQAKRAPQSHLPVVQNRSDDALSHVSSDGSSGSAFRRPRSGRHAKVELRTHGTMAYAALQSQDYGHFKDGAADRTSDPESTVPTQSVENDPLRTGSEEWSDEMDLE